MLTIHGEWFVPIVRLVTRDQLSDDYTQATLPAGHPHHNDLRIDVARLHEAGDLLTGKDKAFRHAVLLAQIAVYAQHARTWAKKDPPLLYSLLEEYEIALTLPEGEVWMRPRATSP